jgi:hypothetical protein
MSFRYATTFPLDPTFLIGLRNRLADFARKWRSVKKLEAWGKPDGCGSPEDIRCLDYVVYEGLYSLFCKDEEDFFFLSAAVMGCALENLLRAEWCEFQLLGARTIGLVNRHNNVRTPIKEMIVHRLSTDPQDASFEYLFFDVYLSNHYWPLGTHPLVDCNLNQLDDEPSFKEIYGYEVPADIMKRVFLLGFQSEEDWIRNLGLDAYELSARQEWDRLRESIQGVEGLYDSWHGKAWRQRAEEDYAFRFGLAGDVS